MRGLSEQAGSGRVAARRLTALATIRRDRVLRAGALAAVVHVVVFAVLVSRESTRTAADILSTVVLLVAFGLMTTAAVRRRAERESARVWFLLALATFLTTVGMAIWLVGLRLDGTAGYYGVVANCLFVAASTAVVGGFATALQRGHRSGRLWLGFDLTLVATGAGALAWRVFLPNGPEAVADSDRTALIVLPICSIVTLLFLLPMGALPGRRLPPSIALVGWAYVLGAVCGCGTLWSAISGRHELTEPMLSAGYQLAIALLALAALTALRTGESDEAHFSVGHDWSMLPSLIAAGAAVLGLAVVYARGAGLQVPLLVAGLVVVGLLTRLSLVVRDRTRLADQLAEALAEQQRLAITDSLTGLANRRYFEQSLATEVVRARRTRRPLGLVVLDLDHFKQINDKYGHAAGDAVLTQVGALLQVITRDSDVVARYGGEEFVWLLPDTDEEGTAAMAERLCATLAAHPVALPSGDPIWVTGSLGVAAALGTVDATVLVTSADEAMYRAKSAGRNQVARASDAVSPKPAPEPSPEPRPEPAPEPTTRG